MRNTGSGVPQTQVDVRPDPLVTRQPGPPAWLLHVSGCYVCKRHSHPSFIREAEARCQQDPWGPERMHVCLCSLVTPWSFTRGPRTPHTGLQAPGEFLVCPPVGFHGLLLC